MKRVATLFLLGLLFVLSTAAASAADTESIVVLLTSDVPSGQPAGSVVNWTLATDAPGPVDYRLSVGQVGGVQRVMYDFDSATTFEWAPIEEGLYIVQGSVRNLNNGSVTTVGRLFQITARATTQPVVTPTENPLVALYSAPPCSAGQQMRVLFKPLSGTGVSATNLKPCRTGRSMNFYVMGMRALKGYVMVHEIQDGAGNPVDYGPLTFFLTGAPTLAFPARTLAVPPGGDASFLEPIHLLAPTIGSPLAPPFPAAIDLYGRLLWYYGRNTEVGPWLLRPTGEGTFLLSIDEPPVIWQFLREVDAAGHIVRQTSAPRLSEQVEAMGHDPLTAVHHEALRMDNGYTAVIASTERLIPGAQNNDLIMGDMILILDENFQVVWVWNPFDHLDVNRAAVLGEECVSQGPGCPPIFLAEVGNDWMHSNAITPTADGDLLLSLRHQDWIIKIDYQDGAGSGDVLWRLGPEGDFAINSPDPYPFQSHQHDPRFTWDGQLAVFDNGNTRCSLDPENCTSRGMVFEIDETNMVVTTTTSATLDYSFALGGAQPLLNGHFTFASGIEDGDDGYFSSMVEVRPDGTIAYQIDADTPMYRAWRLSTMYSSPGDGNPVSRLAAARLQSMIDRFDRVPR